MQQHRNRLISGKQPFQPRQQGLALALQVPAVTVARRQRQLKSQALRAPEVHPVRAGCVGLWGRTEGIVTMPTEKGLGDAVQCCQLPAQMLHRLRIVAAQRQILQHQISLAGTAAPANRPGHAHGCGSSQFFQPGRFGSEAPFAPRINAKDEDDGYLVSFIADLETDKSECVLIDAKNIAAGPVCRIILPERICSGTHSVWASGDDIGMGDNSVLAA